MLLPCLVLTATGRNLSASPSLSGTLRSVPRPIGKRHSSAQLGSLHCDLCAPMTHGFRGMPPPLVPCSSLSAPPCVQPAHPRLSSPTRFFLIRSVRLSLSSGSWHLSAHVRSPARHYPFPTTFALQPGCHFPHQSPFRIIPSPARLRAACSRETQPRAVLRHGSLLLLSHMLLPQTRSISPSGARLKPQFFLERLPASHQRCPPVGTAMTFLPSQRPAVVGTADSHCRDAFGRPD